MYNSLWGSRGAAYYKTPSGLVKAATYCTTPSGLVKAATYCTTPSGVVDAAAHCTTSSRVVEAAADVRLQVDHRTLVAVCTTPGGAADADVWLYDSKWGNRCGRLELIVHIRLIAIMWHIS